MLFVMYCYCVTERAPGAVGCANRFAAKASQRSGCGDTQLCRAWCVIDYRQNEIDLY